MNRYREYGNKTLVGAYIFNFPAGHHEETGELREELERRGLMEWADQTFRELYEIFNDKWVEKEKEIEEEEAKE